MGDAQRRRIIFLDIDGVLLPFPKNDNEPSLQLFPKSTLQAIQRLLRATNFPRDCQVVLSSTWRVRDDFIYDILEALQEFGIPIEAFHDITDPKLHSERQWEIYDWLQKNDAPSSSSSSAIEAWLALDDEDLVEGDVNQKHRDVFMGHVIKTESSVGLTMKDVDEAIRLWEAQLRQTTEKEKA